MQLTDNEREYIRIFFKQIFNNIVINDKINAIDSKSFFRKIIDCKNDYETIKELKRGICKPCLVLDCLGLIKLKYFSSTDIDKKINGNDTILIQYDTFELWYMNNEIAINAFLDIHSNIDKLKYELIAIFFEKNIEKLLT